MSITVIAPAGAGDLGFGGGGQRGAGGGRPDGSGARKDPADVAQLIDHPVSLRRIAQLFRPHRWPLIAVTALIVATSVAGLATPFLTRDLIDDAIPNQNVSLLLTLIGAMLGITVLTAAFGVLQTYLSTAVGQQVMHELRTTLFAHLQRMPLGFFTRTRGGEVQSRLTNDINGMQSVVTSSATGIASNVTTVVGTAAAMAVLSWQLSLLSLIVLPPAVLLTRKVARMRRTVRHAAQRELAGMQTQIEESLSISGVHLAKTMGAAAGLSSRFAASSTKLTELELQSQVAGRWRMASMSLIFAVIPALIYLAAGLPATSAGMTIGTLVAFTALQTQLFRPLMGVLNVGVEITGSLALFSRVFEYLDLPVEIDDPEHPIALPQQSARGQVRLTDVTFRYPGATADALHGINLELAAGSTTAIVGATGSGKSTLAGLLSRLHDPDTGSVTIDGVDLRDMNLSNVADLVGVVAQDFLLHASIADNLRYARPDATDDALVAAARAARIHDLIITLPQGYDTMVGSRGHRFSGGERQRIALARAILRDPVVLVLDEATSALDNSTEAQVQQALAELSRSRTTLAIAHRLSTVRDADQIVVLDGGRIVERGRHEELIALGGRYAALLRSQERHEVAEMAA